MNLRKTDSFVFLLNNPRNRQEKKKKLSVWIWHEEKVIGDQVMN